MGANWLRLGVSVYSDFGGGGRRGCGNELVYEREVSVRGVCMVRGVSDWNGAGGVEHAEGCGEVWQVGALLAY